ncbi:MAG: hypothetical protein II841_04805 [Bacteroidales bacterium]|nr:hypothetical protein [Bacteroidales bacterium]
MNDIEKRLASSKVLKTVGEIEKEREEARRLPTHALFTELRGRTGLDGEALGDAVEDLAAKGFVEWGRTINDYWVRLKK